MRFGLALAALATMLLVFVDGQTARAHQATAGDITLDHPWGRPAQKGHNGAVYVRIVNGADAADRLIAVRTHVADKVELHLSTQEDGIHRMRPVEAVPVPAGETVDLKPGGYHVMLIGLETMLMLEERIPITFVFENAGEIATTFAVEQRVGGHDAGMDHDMDHGDRNAMEDHKMDHGDHKNMDGHDVHHGDGHH